MHLKTKQPLAYQALQWIHEILNNGRINYQITGGLAAKIYGANRTLVDIDIDLPNHAMNEILPVIQPYLSFGPARYKDEHWDILLMTVNYHGQSIDFSGVDDCWLFDKNSKAWIAWYTNFNEVSTAKVDDLTAPVIKLKDLMMYKSILSREVDRLDLKALNPIRQ